ncbi:MAG TPA: hypothetical protein VM074_06670 [Solimonas sp.]|nr:hypothetical protein [Solimonas sp.]
MAALMVPTTATAHGFGRLYNLPVPFWLYAWGAGAALLVSFVLVASFAASPAALPPGASRDIGDAAWVRALRRVLPALRAFSVFVLLLCIATGLFGNRDPFRNFSMTCFWVVFVLGFTYLTALAGDLYAAINPWRVMTDAMGRYGRGRVCYRDRLGDWPALALYLAFVWYELFNHGKPASLAAMLLAYSALNFAGVWLVGTAAWFRHCEFFSVFLRLVALMAPLHYRRGEALRWRRPFAGLAQERPGDLSTVVFALAMLSTTAFDGLRATQWWVSLFWNDPSGILTGLAGARPVHAYALVRPWYIAWETLWLVASPFAYLAAYLAAVALARLVTRSTRPMRELALDFGYTLLPIALVYNLTHYATLLLSQGLKIVSLASDPFGWGWNLLGTAGLLRAPILPGMGLVWHTQVGLILLGHVLSVHAAHRVALRVFPTRGQALLSQLPMLALMVALTVAGLWILAQPLTAVLMR